MFSLLRIVAGRLFAVAEGGMGVPLVVVALLVSIYTMGHMNGTKACEQKQMQIEQKLEKKHDKIEKNVDSLSDPALDKRLRVFQRD